MTTATTDSATSVRDRILDASRRGTGLRVVGRGTWLDAGRPVRANETVSTDALTGITQYVPGDLTLTALAGTTLGEIRAATAQHGQWLALDPFGADEGTIGATVATASAGPLYTSFGRPRDLVLGVEFVTGTGKIARGGGRVVKNVAGFDLTRLMTGSWGTLGVITEVTVRLHARPETEESIAVALDDPGEGPSRMRQLLRRLPFTPYACEVLNETLAQHLVGSSSVTALVRLGGNAESVRAQRAAFTELGDAKAMDESIWQRLRTVEPARAIVFRLSQLASEIDRPWSEGRAVALACPETMLHVSPARGVVRCIVPETSTDAVAAIRAVFERNTTVKRIGERLPPELWQRCTPPGADPLSARIKAAFDPRGVLNPGIFGDLT